VKNTIDARCTHGTCASRNHYVMTASCSNCEWEGLILIRNGHEKRDAERSAQCPRCQCRTVKAGTFEAGNGFEGA
jgi:hypothetical protein